jgi:hypothetical protein
MWQVWSKPKDRLPSLLIFLNIARSIGALVPKSPKEPCLQVRQGQERRCSPKQQLGRLEFHSSTSLVVKWSKFLWVWGLLRCVNYFPGLGWRLLRLFLSTRLMPSGERDNLQEIKKRIRLSTSCWSRWMVLVVTRP